MINAKKKIISVATQSKPDALAVPVVDLMIEKPWKCSQLLVTYGEDAPTGIRLTPDQVEIIMNSDPRPRVTWG